MGRRVVQALVSEGHRVRIAARHPGVANGSREPDTVERVRADLFAPETLSKALAGADGAVNATSLYLERGDASFEAVHVEAAGRLATLARQAGVRRFVQMSGIGADRQAADRYIRARGRGEEAVREAFPKAVIVRSAVMFGEGDALVPAIVKAARLSPVMPLFGSGRMLLQPVSVEDVAAGITVLLTGDGSDDLFEFGGPRVLSYRRLVREVLEMARLRRPLLPVPFAVWRPLARVAESLPGAPLTRSQVALMEFDNVADDNLPGLSDLVASRTDVGTYLQRAIAE